MGLVLDTSALVSGERMEEGFAATLEVVGSEPVLLPAIVLAELLAGVELADSPSRAAARRGRVEALAQRVPVVPFSGTTALVWARLFGELRRCGSMIPSNDLMVASTALERGFGVLVGPQGEDHFGRVEGLRVVRVG